MTWPDFVTIVLVIGIGAIESKRGFVPAVIDMIGMVLVLSIVGSVYRNMVSPTFTAGNAFLVALIIGIIVLGVISTLAKRYTQIDIGSFDSALAGIFGLVTGLIISHAVFHYVIISEGAQSATYVGSVMAGQVYELRAVHSFLDFMGRIGTSDIAR